MRISVLGPAILKRRPQVRNRDPRQVCGKNLSGTGQRIVETAGERLRTGLGTNFTLVPVSHFLEIMHDVRYENLLRG